MSVATNASIYVRFSKIGKVPIVGKVIWCDVGVDNSKFIFQTVEDNEVITVTTEAYFVDSVLVKKFSPPISRRYVKRNICRIADCFKRSAYYGCAALVCDSHDMVERLLSYREGVKVPACEPKQKDETIVSPFVPTPIDGCPAVGLFKHDFQVKDGLFECFNTDGQHVVFASSGLYVNGEKVCDSYEHLPINFVAQALQTYKWLFEYDDKVSGYVISVKPVILLGYLCVGYRRTK